MAVLRFFSLIAWTAVFVVVLLFAIKNADPVTLRFYFDAAWQTPLVLLVLASFAAGAVLGVIACLPALARQRREAVRLRKELELHQPGASGPA
ncbi:MAG: LapA family protein, partial [Burkholderiales bacterium]